MDIDALLAHSRAKFDHAAAKRVLKEKYESKLIFGWQGGLFRAEPTMISFLAQYQNQTVVIKDLYDTPVQVIAAELCEAMKAVWQEQMNAWHLEFQEISVKR